MLIAGAATLTVAMGFGRFAYTPMLPLMELQAGLSPAVAGYAASGNLVGYLLGALLAMAPPMREVRVAMVRWSLAIVVVTTALMAVQSAPLWIVSRFVTGLASGCAFVLSASIILDYASAPGRAHWVGVFFGGVGAGIALTGVLVPVLNMLGGWRNGWLGIAVVAAAMTCTSRWLREAPPVARASLAPTATATANRSKLLPWLLVAYGGEGLAYIVPATFMVAMFVSRPALRPFANLSWIIVGLAAAPSTYLWSELARRVTRGRALCIALVVQAFALIAPVLTDSPAGVIVAAVGLGATFMGITGLGSAMGRELAPHRSNLTIGALTMAFGAGQVVGPLGATAALSLTGSYDPAMIGAALVAMIGSVVLFAGLAVTR